MPPLTQHDEHVRWRQRRRASAWRRQRRASAAVVVWHDVRPACYGGGGGAEARRRPTSAVAVGEEL